MYVLPDFKVDPIKTQFLYWTFFFFFLSFRIYQQFIQPYQLN